MLRKDEGLWENQQDFLEYERQENEAIQPLSRITNFNEFHPFLDEETRRKQGARCMNCGVPFCQSAIKLSSSFANGW